MNLDTPRLTRSVSEEVDSILRDFHDLLEKCDTEEEVHRFLVRHPVLFPSGGSTGLFSKVKLGSSYVTDFVYGIEVTAGIAWVLVEIERPDHKLFTKRGDISAPLAHAISQVATWRRWLAEDFSRAEKLFPLLCNFTTEIVIGRREELSENDKGLLGQLNRDNVSAVEIMTFDRFSDSLRRNPLRVSAPSSVGSFKDLVDRRWQARFPVSNAWVRSGDIKDSNCSFRSSAYYPSVDAHILRCGISADKKCRHPDICGQRCPVYPDAVKALLR